MWSLLLTVHILDHTVRGMAKPDPIEQQAWWDDVVMPAMLESARRTYGMAIRRALLDAGFDDVPFDDDIPF